jgi:diguanylate cyclase (GGDEF)-like protein/PAS domain S-box-containing protein
VTPKRTAHSVAMASAALRTSGSNPVIRGFPEGAIVAFDEELRYVVAGGHGLAMVGLTSEMIEGKTIFEVFPPEVSDVLEDPYRRALAGEEVQLDIHFEGRIFLHRLAPLVADDGETITAGVGFALDVTDVRLAETSLRESEDNLRHEQRRLRDAEFVGHSGSWEWDLTSDVITWSDGLFAIHGLDRTNFDDGYIQAASRVHPGDREIVDAAIEKCRHDEPVHFRYRVLRASDDAVRWFESRATAVVEEGIVVRLVGAVADVTDRIVAEEGVVEANRFMNAVLTASPDYTFITDIRTGTMIYGSRDRDLLGRSAEDSKALGQDTIELLVHPDDQEGLRQLNIDSAHLADGEVLQHRYRLRHIDGEWHWLSRHVVAFRRDADGNVIEVLGVLRDITDVVNAENQLVHDALHDNLTGLANRALLLDRLEEALTRSSREEREIAVLYCDLDGFKDVNDTAGHSVGDAVLIETSQRLLGVIRDGDTVARLGGDEFVLVIEPWNRSNRESTVERETDVTRHFTLEIAERIVRALSEPFEVSGTNYTVSVSVGIALGRPWSSDDQGRASAVELLEAADAAMYLAKNAGRNRIHAGFDVTDG